MHDRGSGRGKIETKTLEGVIGVYKTGSKAAANKAGLELYPVHKTGPFAEYTCGVKEISVRGAVVLPIIANKGVGPTLKMSGKARRASRRQKAWSKNRRRSLNRRSKQNRMNPSGSR